MLGRVVGHIHVVEFQKRGLPHAHILLIMAANDKPHSADDFDKVVCAEIPNPDTHSQLYATVTTTMMHRPCGRFSRHHYTNILLAFTVHEASQNGISQQALSQIIFSLCLELPTLKRSWAYSRGLLYFYVESCCDDLLLSLLTRPCHVALLSLGRLAWSTQHRTSNTPSDRLASRGHAGSYIQ